MELLLHRPTACCRAFQCADAHHEKLVQVRAQDGEKSDPGKERHTRILRQLQYPGVELDQAQVAIQEVLWPRAVDVENGGVARNRTVAPGARPPGAGRLRALARSAASIRQ